MAIKGGDGAYSNTATTLVTTAETILVTVGPIDVPADSVRAVVIGMAQIATGTGVTSLVPRIRRGTAVTDPLVGAAAQEVSAASIGGQVNVQAQEALAGFATVTYSLSVTQTGATGNGTNNQASILVLFL